MPKARATVAPGPAGADRWYGGGEVTGRRGVLDRAVPRALARARLRACAAPALLAACALAGCGGSEQDAHEPQGTFDVQVLRASFPAKQAVAKPTTLEIEVRNSGTRALPNVAVALDSLQYTEKFPQLSDNKRPVWAIEQGPGKKADPPVQSVDVSTPGSGSTSYVNTWALGPLAAGATQTFRWELMPVKPGPHTVAYSVFAGLAGKAKAQLSSGAPAKGSFSVVVAPAPAKRHVNPSTGRIEPGAAPPVSAP